MPDRLSALDVTFLAEESRTRPMHGGHVAIFEAPEGGLAFDRLLEHIGSRLILVPRFRQKVRSVPASLANPIWVDDDRFELDYHVRRVAVAPPGTDQQLHDVVARIQSRLLDRSRPLWELYVVEGLTGGRFALITKTHQAVVDSVRSPDLFQVLLDPDIEPSELPQDDWVPAPGPSRVQMVAEAMADLMSDPESLPDVVRTNIDDARSVARAVVGPFLGVAAGVWRAIGGVESPVAESPFNAQVGQHRRFATVRTDLDTYRRIRKAYRTSVNDVVLSTVTGALRAWLLARGEAVPPAATVRAMVPVSVRDDDPEQRDPVPVSTLLVELPIGEPSAAIRLHRITFVTRRHVQSGRAVEAEALTNLEGFAPPTVHALATRVVRGLAGRTYNLLVANVPGPQHPLYLGGARMTEVYPVVPLSPRHALAIGVTSYDGHIYFGLDGDWDAMPDIDLLAECIEDSVAELEETVA